MSVSFYLHVARIQGNMPLLVIIYSIQAVQLHAQELSSKADKLALTVAALVSFLCILAAVLLVLAVAYLCIATRSNSQAAKNGLFERFLGVIAVLFAAIGAYGTIFQAYVAWIDLR